MENIENGEENEIHQMDLRVAIKKVIETCKKKLIGIAT